MIKSTTDIAEEQRNARSEILTCAELLLKGDGCASLFAGAVREYLHAEIQLEAYVTPRETKQAKLLLVDVIEEEFAKCTHPNTLAGGDGAEWCNVCGGRFLPRTPHSPTGTWLRPRWREIMIRALLAGIFAFCLLACGGAPDVGTIGNNSDAGAPAKAQEMAAAAVVDAQPVVEAADAGPDVLEAEAFDSWNDSKDEQLELVDAAADAGPDVHVDAAPDAPDVVDAAADVADAQPDVADAAPLTQQCTALPPDQGGTTYVCNPRAYNPWMCGHSCCTLRLCP